MGRMWIGVFVVLGLAAFLPVGVQVQTIDPERRLAERFRFTADELARARSGQAVAKMLPRNGATDVGVVAAVRINAQTTRLVDWLRNIADFRRAAELGQARRLSDQPQLDDFADLTLDAGELAALRECRPGRCDLLLGDPAITRFKTDVDWTSADAGQRASRVMRQLLLDYAGAYLKGGDRALGALHDEKHPRARVDEFHQVLWQSKELYNIAPALTAYLEQFPASPPTAVEQFLYWARPTAGPETSLALNQMVISSAPGGDTLVVDKQLFASRYVDARLLVISLAPVPGGEGFYAIVGARARSRLLGGTAARLLRGTVEKSTLDTTTMYLEWVRASLTM